MAIHESADARAVIKAVPEPADRGLDDYREFQERLSHEIMPDEAERARRLTHTSLRAFLAGAACVVVLALAAGTLRRHLPGFADWILGIMPLLVAMALVTRWRVPFAGRLILPLAALLAPTYSDVFTPWFTAGTLVSEPQRHTDTLAMAFRLAGALLVGWAVDGAARGGRTWPRRLGRVLFVFAIALALVLIAPRPQRIWSSDFDLPGAENLLRAALLVAWAGFAHRRFANAERNGPQDAGVVFRIALSRWQRMLVGRLLAVLSLLVVMIAVINGFALPDALAPDGPDRAVRAELAGPHGQGTSEKMLLWPRAGRLLRESDFRDGNRSFYVVDPGAEALSDLLQRYMRSNVYTSVNAFGYDRLQRELAPWRARSGGEFAAALEKHPDTPISGRQIWLLERLPGRDPQDTAYALEPLHRVLIPTDETGLQRFGNLHVLAMLGSGVFACLAFVVLWRRGGDSAGARWTGLWLAGIAMSFSLPIVELVLESTLIDAAQGTREAKLRITASGTTGLLYVFSYATGALAMLGVMPWMAYRHLRPAATKSGEPSASASPGRWRSLLDGPLPVLAGIAAVAWLVLWLSHERAVPATTAVTIAGVATLLGTWALERLRRPLLASSPRTDPRLGIGMPVALFFVAAQAFLVFSFGLRADGMASLTPAGTWVAAAMLTCFAVAATVFLLRSEWLRVSAGHDLSWLVTAFLMPLLFEVVNSSLPEKLDSLDIFLPGASSVASFLVVVALMQPIQRGLEAAFRQIASRALRRIERRVDALLEDALVGPEPQELVPRVERLFGELGIDGYALYTRAGPCGFSIEIDRLAGSRSFALSEGLCRRLARSDAVIDLDMVHAEWRYFFDQFELYRLARSTNSRYLYRVRIGGALGGILVLGDSPAAQGIARDAFAETASALGIVLSRWRR